MPQYFNFARLIRKYSTEFTAVISSGGTYDNKGDYQAAGAERRKLTGAIIAHRQSKIFRSEGTLTAQDRALYMLEPLSDSLHGAEIVYKDNVYRIGDLLENSEFAGVWSYTLKYVSAFNERGDEA